MAWRSVRCLQSELNLDITLSCGQAFRWRKKNGVWTGALLDRVYSLKQTETELLYSCHGKSELKNNEAILVDYLNLSVNLTDLYKDWAASDRHFSAVADQFQGIRMLRQDPTETLFAFICSANNHITRISAMMERLCGRFGKRLANVSGEDFFAFPAIEALAKEGVEEELRQLGFGYRAKYVAQSARQLQDAGGRQFLAQLRSASYDEAQEKLRQFSGIGQKVADCICLFSLDKYDVIPVDTHVWQIASRDYLPQLAKHKSLNDELRKLIGNCFRKLFGPYAGWAHSVLFCADLKKFKDLKAGWKDVKGVCKEGSFSHESPVVKVTYPQLSR